MSSGLQERDNGVSFILLISRQGKVRLAKWYTTMPPRNKAKVVKDVTQLVLARRTRMCNFLEYKGALPLAALFRFQANPPRPRNKDSKIVYRRYASLFFVCGIGPQDNELITLEVIHRYVEVLDRYFGNVCELDLIFNYQKAYSILDELIIAGEMQESSKKSVLKAVGQADQIEEQELSEDPLGRLGQR
ncbi:AP-1 complex subunit sigma-1 [Rhodotorula toruloides]|nr:AP-1 complex subunit sigma-1 [Rhodotorula toruloides]